MVFIFVTIGMLAGVCALFPEEGVSVGEDLTLSFPSVEDMLSGGTEEATGPTPEELLAMHEQEMQMAAEQEYIRYFTSNPTRIHMPDSACTYLDSLFAALEGADTTKVRIVHYGDSQLEGDRMTCVLRDTLQTRFGGMGAGMIPLQANLFSLTVNQTLSKELTKYMLYGPQSGRRDSSLYYGPMAAVTILDSTAVLSVSPYKRPEGLCVSQQFSEMTVLTRSDRNMRVSAQGNTVSIAPSGAALQSTTITLKDSTSRFSATFSGDGDVYGILLDGHTGVNVDNIALRGCSGTIFTGIASKQLSTFFSVTNTRLIILQFGGNSMPYLKSEQGVKRYVEQLRRQVRYMQKQAPHAAILFIGPSDMTTKVNGTYQTYPLLSKVDQAICQMVNEEGCAYWSLFESMGGAGSMMRWAKSNPALAGSDYVHFTRKGAMRAGQLLAESLMAAYRYYDFRRPQPEPTIPDSLQPVHLEPLVKSIAIAE